MLSRYVQLMVVVFFSIIGFLLLRSAVPEAGRLMKQLINCPETDSERACRPSGYQAWRQARR